MVRRSFVKLPKSQSGAVLLVSLVLLLVMTIIGVRSMQTTSLGERMSVNYRNEEFALINAERAMKEAEGWVAGIVDDKEVPADFLKPSVVVSADKDQVLVWSLKVGPSVGKEQDEIDGLKCSELRDSAQWIYDAKDSLWESAYKVDDTVVDPDEGEAYYFIEEHSMMETDQSVDTDVDGTINGKLLLRITAMSVMTQDLRRAGYTGSAKVARLQLPGPSEV
jgi:hypothetical protein